MRRRDFLKFLRKPAALLAAAPVVAAAAASPQDLDAGGVAALRRQCARLKRRMDRMDAAQKRTMRIVLGLAAITIGIDLSLLI